MILLAVVAEGQTEVEFVSEVLADHLRPRNVQPTPVAMDGNMSIQRLAECKARLFGTALYPRGSQEKRLLDAMLLVVPQ